MAAAVTAMSAWLCVNRVSLAGGSSVPDGVRSLTLLEVTGATNATRAHTADHA